MEINKNIRVCVIGAGTAGLSALKNSLQFNLEVVCYEQGNQIGGTWVYEEPQPNMPCEEEVHSSMYQGLRTNLPKEVMGFPDFTYPDSFPQSFVSSDDVLKFLNLYADHFQLKSHIRFQHEVIRVRPRSHKEWEVHVWNHNTKELNIEYYDRIFVCNGHYTKAQYPDITGMDIYRGVQLHSHLYRSAAMFQDETVLIIGAGPSGMDLANHISKTAKRVFLSHHLAESPSTDFMVTVTQKPDVKCFTETGAIFKDDSAEEFNYVVYCTGYQYSFPFLSCDCGVRVENNHVQPMYKQCINIEYPTMAIIGLPYLVLPTQCFDLQIRFALKHFTNEKEFPTKQEMMAELKRDLHERRESGMKEYDAHKMGPKQYDYYKDLSELAGISNIKPVVAKIMKDCGKKYIYELETYRQHNFTVLDDENFVKISLK